jgi:hypothetical protein
MAKITFLETQKNKNYTMIPVLADNICNPSYSGGRNQENHCLKAARAQSLRDPISKIPNAKTELVEWLKWYSSYLANMKP